MSVKFIARILWAISYTLRTSESEHTRTKHTESVRRRCKLKNDQPRYGNHLILCWRCCLSNVGGLATKTILRHTETSSYISSIILYIQTHTFMISINLNVMFAVASESYKRHERCATIVVRAYVCVCCEFVSVCAIGCGVESWPGHCQRSEPQNREFTTKFQFSQSPCVQSVERFQTERTCFRCSSFIQKLNIGKALF